MTGGWFVVNCREARWLHDDYTARCRFGGEGEAHFDDIGIALYRLAPGRPMALYHDEAGQEDFLVLHGSCTLIIEGVQRKLTAWDFVHCPSRTRHTLIATQDGPAVVLAVGARVEKGSARYPVEPTAIAHGAGVPNERTSAAEEYERFGTPTPGLAPALPW